MAQSPINGVDSCLIPNLPGGLLEALESHRNNICNNKYRYEHVERCCRDNSADRESTPFCRIFKNRTKSCSWLDLSFFLHLIMPKVTQQ